MFATKCKRRTGSRQEFDTEAVAVCDNQQGHGMKVQREAFLHALESVAVALAKRENLVEQGACFVLEDGNASAYNEEIYCRAPTGLGKEISGVVHGQKLLDQLRKWPDDEIEVRQGKGELLLDGKAKHAGIRMEAEVLLKPEIENPKSWSKLHEDFGEAAATVGRCASTDQSQFAYTCVHIAPEWVEAMDNKQVCRWPVKTGVKSPILVRSTAIGHVSSLGMSEISETDSWLWFRSPSGLVMAVRRYLEEYRELDKLLKVRGEPITLPKGLIEAAERAQVFTEENKQLGEAVAIKLLPGKVVVRGQGITGWYKQSCKCVYKGPTMKFLVHPKILMDLVSKHSEAMVAPERLLVKAEKYVWVGWLEMANGTGEDE